jgi:DNA-3-methyladenine glycosylase I
MKQLRRCSWAESDDAERRYHDREWGVPEHRDRQLFELLILEGAQAGLSWSTILGKRAGYRRAFAGFNIARLARFTARHASALLKDPGIVRNRLKIRSAINNAKAALAIRREWGSLDRFLWRFVDDRPLQNARTRGRHAPARTRQSDALSAALRDAGFSFVGSTICYAFMQAVGMVNDHAPDCFRFRQVHRLAIKDGRPTSPTSRRARSRPQP